MTAVDKSVESILSSTTPIAELNLPTVNGDNITFPTHEQLKATLVRLSPVHPGTVKGCSAIIRNFEDVALALTYFFDVRS